MKWWKSYNRSCKTILEKMFLSLVLWWQKDGFDSFCRSWVSLNFCILNLLMYNSITLDWVSAGWLTTCDLLWEGAWKLGVGVWKGSKREKVSIFEPGISLELGIIYIEDQIRSYWLVLALWKAFMQCRMKWYQVYPHYCISWDLPVIFLWARIF